MQEPGREVACLALRSVLDQVGHDGAHVSTLLVSLGLNE